MWFLVALAACENPFPEAFEWRIDRTLVPGLNLVEALAEEGTARRIDALVLSPYAIDSVAVEVCGLVTDGPASIGDPACFGEPDLVRPVADGVPASWTPPDLDYPCDAPFDAPDSRESGFGDSGNDLLYTCASFSLLRVVARTSEDEGSAMTPLGISPFPIDAPTTADPALGAPSLEIVSGDPRAGGEVTLRFSVAGDWYGRRGVSELRTTAFRWYVDDGELLGTGRTARTGILPSGRWYSDNTLRIPDGYEGPLRVAALTGSIPQLWQVLTLEVP